MWTIFKWKGFINIIPIFDLLVENSQNKIKQYINKENTAIVSIADNQYGLSYIIYICSYVSFFYRFTVVSFVLLFHSIAPFSIFNCCVRIYDWMAPSSTIKSKVINNLLDDE